MRKFLLNFSYDGTDFYGWQSQKDMITIQSVMEECLINIFKQETDIIASGRTDRGVHAYNQYAHFSVQTRMLPANIIKAVNRILPKSIFIKNCQEMKPDFHARFSAKSRTYLYKINKRFSPFERNYAVTFPSKKISSEKIRKSLRYLVGTHDFNVFANDTSQLKNMMCAIISANWKADQEQYQLSITANRFLHNMVRRIVGALIKISHNDLPDNYIQMVLEKGDKKMLGTTAPPQGLYLYEVEY